MKLIDCSSKYYYGEINYIGFGIVHENANKDMIIKINGFDKNWWHNFMNIKKESM